MKSLPGALGQIVIVTLLASSWTACLTGRVNYDYSKEPDPRGQEYIIGVSDLVRVSVWKDQDLTTETRVRPDGTITMPLAGELRAAGRTPSQLRTEIKQKLSPFYKNAETELNVQVGVPEVKSYVFTVSGNAEKPGRFTAERYVTVLEALTLAGGPNRFAETHNLSVLRNDVASGRTKRIPIDYELLKNGEHLEQNVVVLSGDVILIP